MNTLIAEVRQIFIPDWSGKDGPLPPLLVAMTFVTGLVDAFSYLSLGHVFVANMTGNVVFIGFALAGAPGFSIAASVVAMASFWVGAIIGGRAGDRFETRRVRLLGVTSGVQVVLVTISIVLAEFGGHSFSAGYRYPLIFLLAVSMGIQNATARLLAVPDLTTTVLTMTLTGMGADTAIGSGKGSHVGRRFVAIVSMLLGALVGAECVVHLKAADALIFAVAVLAVVAVAANLLEKSHAAWLEKR